MHLTARRCAAAFPDLRSWGHAAAEKDGVPATEPTLIGAWLAAAT